MARFLVVGLGNIGLRVAWDLSSRGHLVLGVDASASAVERARSLGIEAVLGDYRRIDALLNRGFDVVVTSLPGSIGFDAVSFLASRGVNVVDVSFFPEDPLSLAEIASSSGSTIVVDAGVAPGYSNFLVGRMVASGGVTGARIYVGGVSRDPSAPLGLSATWSVDDLLDEYLRPARLINNGRLVRVDPLSWGPGIIDVPGVGRMEYFPTDGLRSLLYSYGWLEELVEYTLRWPGHIEAMRLLHRLGLLSSDPISVDGASVAPRRLLAEVIRRATRGVEDLVVMVVEGRGRTLGYRLVQEPQGEWSAMSIATGSFQAAVAEYVAEGHLGPGLVLPERLGEDEESYNMISRLLRERGLEAVSLT